MYGKQEYKKDLAFINKIERMISSKVELVAYYCGLISCLFAHIFYFVVFWRYGVREMAYFNIFSVMFYLVLVIIVKRIKHRINLVYLSIFEIIIHVTLATILIGWKPDFGMFLLMLIPIAFLMPNKSQQISEIIMFISLVLYGYLRLAYSDKTRLLYNLDDDIITTVLFVVNFIIGSAVLIFVTSIYAMANRYTQSKLRTQNEQLRIMARIDPLTQLNNRRAMNEEMKKIRDDSKKAGDTYVMAIGDIDDFKKVNDTYGHDCGDLVLKKVAEIIGNSVPEYGRAARWGGEEFIFAIPRATIEDGVRCADSIIGQIREHVFTSDGVDFIVTMTFGVCECASGSDIEKNLSHADELLYKGKNNGKNHTEYQD